MKAIKYMNLVNELYGTNMNLDQNKLDDIEKALKRYLESDLEKVVRFYYSKKNITVAPKLSQIIAILETWIDEKKIKYEDVDVKGSKYTLPKTNIFKIKDCFDRLVRLLVVCGVIPDSNGDFNKSYSLIKDGLPMMNPQQMLRWYVEDAEKECPDLFVDYKNASWIEKLAISIQNKLVKLEIKKI